jgi:hypothetical protein
LPERRERLGHRALRRYDDVHQQVSAVRRRRNVFHEQIGQAVIGMSIGQRKIQCALDLSTELPRLAFGLPARGKTIGCASAQSLGKVWIYEIC